MEFKFSNYAKPSGPRTSVQNYDWLVFMDMPEKDLDQVSKVVYKLHETFPNPIRANTDRESRFALRSGGWGEFTIHITVVLKNGRKIPLEYELDLSRPWPAEAERLDSRRRPPPAPAMAA